MKKQNFNVGMRTVTVLCLFAGLVNLVACNNGNKDNNNNANPNAQIAGINYGGFQSFGTQNCSFLNNNSYSCTESTYAGPVSTQIITFNSQQELCNQIRNEALHTVNASNGLSIQVAYNVRLNYVNNNCTAYPNTTGTNGTTLGTDLIRNIKCKLRVEGYDESFGETPEFQPYIPASGMSGNIYASMVKNRTVWKIFSLTTVRDSERYATVRWNYTKGSGSSGDQLRLGVQVKNGPFAEITGFAGSNVEIEMENPGGDVARMLVYCRVDDANTVGTQNTSSEIKCSVKGSDTDEKSPQVLSVSDLIANSTTLATSEKSNSSVVLAAEGSMTVRSGTATYTASHSSGWITAKANLNTPSAFRYRQHTDLKISKMVDVRCK